MGAGRGTQRAQTPRRACGTRELVRVCGTDLERYYLDMRSYALNLELFK